MNGHTAILIGRTAIPVKCFIEMCFNAKDGIIALALVASSDDQIESLWSGA